MRTAFERQKYNTACGGTHSLKLEEEVGYYSHVTE